MSVEVIEFLRRLTAKVPGHKKRRQICICMPNGIEMTVDSVVDNYIRYSFGSNSGVHTWIPKGPHVVERIDYEKLNQLSKDSILLRPKNRAMIYLKRLEPIQ
jgi:hypothetical protein